VDVFEKPVEESSSLRAALTQVGRQKSWKFGIVQIGRNHRAPTKRVPALPAAPDHPWRSFKWHSATDSRGRARSTCSGVGVALEPQASARQFTEFLKNLPGKDIDDPGLVWSILSIPVGDDGRYQLALTSQEQRRAGGMAHHLTLSRSRLR